MSIVFEALGAALNRVVPTKGKHLISAATAVQTLSNTIREGNLTDFGTDLLSRLSSSRANFLDNLNNANLLNLPNLATLSSSRIGFMDNLNNSNLLNLPNISSLTSSRIGFLDMINNSNLLNVPNLASLSTSRIGFLDNINNAYLGTMPDLSTLWTSWSTDIVTGIKSPLGNFVSAEGLIKDVAVKAIFESILSNDSWFSITTGTSGAKWMYGEVISDLVDRLYEACTDWVNENGTLGNDITFNLPSGKSIKLTNPIGELLDFRINLDVYIESITLFGVVINFPDCTFRGLPDLIWKSLSVKFDWLPDLGNVDIAINNSENWYFQRGDATEPQLGTWYDPDEKYMLVRDGIFKDGQIIAIIVLFGWIVDQLGFEDLYQKFIKKVMKVRNINVASNIVKAFNNTKSIVSNLGEAEDGESTDSVFGRFLKNYNRVTTAITKSDELLEDVVAVSTSSEVTTAKNDIISEVQQTEEDVESTIIAQLQAENEALKKHINALIGVRMSIGN